MNTEEHAFHINHWTMPGVYRQQMTRKQLQEALMKHGDNIMCQGKLRYIRTKHLGAGIYNVWFEAKEAVSDVRDTE